MVDLEGRNQVGRRTLAARPREALSPQLAETYSEFEHRHRFAAWAAARAAQRGLSNGSVEVLTEALETSGLKRLLEDGLAGWPTSKEDVDRRHPEWCGAVAAALERRGVKTAYGRIAKLINVYFKAMLVTGPLVSSDFAKHCHPPIDSLLLKRLSREDAYKQYHALWKKAAWTKLGPEEYEAIIKSFRDAKLDEPVFWKIERYWPGQA